MVIRLLVACFMVGLASGRNVLVILGDDVGFQFGAYGNTKIKSPNVDALAGRSLLFKNGFTSVSSCSPSRSVVLTGLPQHQNGMYGLHSGTPNFKSFNGVKSLPEILSKYTIRTGLSVVLTGLPQHQNGMYGLHHAIQHFQSFDSVMSLPVILDKHKIRTGIVGKKHVGPDTVYKFDYEITEENHNLEQVGRNITCMKHYIREFLTASKKDTRPFLLYIGIHDIHRCGYGGKLGDFCENFGDGMTPGTGVISDWKPIVYNPDDVEVPYFLPDTPATRRDIANMYKTYSRFDQGVGLFMQELQDAGFADDTLVIFTSDNGIPFPLAKTNLYDPGQGEPFLVSSPYHKETWGKKTDAMASTMDIVPTVLDWFQIPYPSYKLMGKQAVLTGKSLLGALEQVRPEPKGVFDQVFSSHNFHEVTMYYPMRVLRTKELKLIHNLNFRMPYPLATDLYLNPTFLDILNRTETGQPLPWITTLEKYYHRDEWQMFNLTSDPYEQTNVVDKPQYETALVDMKKTLSQWLVDTNDPWRCLPGGELEGEKCYPLYNNAASGSLRDRPEL